MSVGHTLRQEDDRRPLNVHWSRIARLWPTFRPALPTFLGMLVAAVPLVFRPTPDWVSIVAFLSSPILVWFGFFSATETLRPRARFHENVAVSFLVYFAVGGAWVASLLLGAWPFDLGRSAMTYLVFALAWPPTFMWILFASLSWFPMS